MGAELDPLPLELADFLPAKQRDLVSIAVIPVI
jgi:hypothetical protein